MFCEFTILSFFQIKLAVDVNDKGEIDTFLTLPPIDKLTHDDDDRFPFALCPRELVIPARQFVSTQVTFNAPKEEAAEFNAWFWTDIEIKKSDRAKIDESLNLEEV